MTDNFEKKVAVDGPVVNAGELGSSTFSPGQALPAGPPGLGQRWTVARKREVVLRLLRDEPVQLLSRQLGVEIFRLEQWREKAIGGIGASLKQRKGDPVQAELDSAMKRIGELTMQVELLEAKTETCGLWGGGGRGDECRHLARHGSGLRPAAGLRRLGHGPLLVLRHDLRPARRAAAGKASGTEARDLGPGAAGGDRSRPGGIALGGRGLPQGLGSASGLSRHPGCPQAGAPPDAREQSALAPSLPPPRRQSP